jgi:hypothetical protein
MGRARAAPPAVRRQLAIDVLEGRLRRRAPPGGNPLAGNPAYEAVKKRAYVHVPRIVSITPPAEVDQFDDSDFSPEAMKTREEKGYAAAKKVLGEGGRKAG